MVSNKLRANNMSVSIIVIALCGGNIHMLNGIAATYARHASQDHVTNQLHLTVTNWRLLLKPPLHVKPPMIFEGRSRTREIF